MIHPSMSNCQSMWKALNRRPSSTFKSTLTTFLLVPPSTSSEVTIPKGKTMSSVQRLHTFSNRSWGNKKRRRSGNDSIWGKSTVTSLEQRPQPKSILSGVAMWKWTQASLTILSHHLNSLTVNHYRGQLGAKMQLMEQGSVTKLTENLVNTRQRRHHKTLMRKIHIYTLEVSVSSMPMQDLMARTLKWGLKVNSGWRLSIRKTKGSQSVAQTQLVAPLTQGCWRRKTVSMDCRWKSWRSSMRPWDLNTTLLSSSRWLPRSQGKREKRLKRRSKIGKTNS